MTHDQTTEWIETTNTKQDGTPVTRSIKLPDMDREIFFTDNAYAEVASSIADLLATNVDSVQTVSEPSSPGSYYGDAGENTQVVLRVADDAVDNLTVERDLTVHQTADLDRADIGVSNGTADTIPVEPVEDALREGYLVGQAPGVNVVIDPRDYASDAHAMQACHDDLLAELGGDNQQGIVRIPPLRPDGTEWVIDQKANSDGHDGYVVFKGDDATGGLDIYPQGWGFDGQQSGAIQLDITDGSPAFEVRSCKLQGGEIGRLRAEGLNGGEDCEFLRLHGVTAFLLNRCEVRGVGGPQQNGVYTFDYRCFNGYINNVRYNSDGQDVTAGSMFAFRDLTDSGWAPSELKFGPGNSTYGPQAAPYGHAFDFNWDFQGPAPTERDNGETDIPSEIYINGRYESYGRHGIYAPEISGNNTASTVILCDNLELGRPEYGGSWSGDSVSGQNWEGTCRVFFESWKLKIGSGVEMPSTGTPDSGNGNGDTPLVYCDASNGVIEPFTSAADTRTQIQIPDDDGGNTLVIPRPETIEGPVDYPDTFFGQLVYPDGWRREATGTATVPAGGNVILYKYTGFGEKMRAAKALPVDPAEEVYCDTYQGATGTNSQTIIAADETSRFKDDGTDPSADYDVEYEIEVKN